MGKQTRKQGSTFGGPWTKQKLFIIDEYLKAYSLILKKQKVKRIYVDGFAGSGKTELKTSATENYEQETFLPDINFGDSETIEGSALLSLKYDFDEYYFLEIDTERIETLKRNISLEYPEKYQKVHFLNGDSNNALKDVINGITCYDRCLMFLDPYSLELKWSTLELISKCGVVDLWYLFPINSLSRLLPKNGKIIEKNKTIINDILGTTGWANTLYNESLQINIFGDVEYDRVSWEEFVGFVKSRFAEIFTYVSPDTKMLKNFAKKSPMFLLCFMMTNNSEKAKAAASRVVKSIISKTEKL